MAGTLTAIEFVRRNGQIKVDGSGELLDFRLLPGCTVLCGNTEVDLRELSIGSHVNLATFADPAGAFSLVAEISDDFTRAARSDAAAPQSNGQTEQLFNRHVDYLRARGLPARIDAVKGKQLTLTLIGDAPSLKTLFKVEHIDSATYAKERSRLHAVVADERLRTYNPPVDGQGSFLTAFADLPTDRFGVGGVQWTMEPSLLLEGFRAGRFIRIFAPQWGAKDMPFGEGLYDEGRVIPTNPNPEASPNQYPYRTDYGNADLPWYALRPGTFPPFESHHLVLGELLSVDAEKRAGQFRVDGSDQVVSFTLPPCGYARRCDGDAELADLPLNERYAFYLYQDERGAFTQAVAILDEFTRLSGDTISYEVESIDLPANKLILATLLGRVKNDRDELYRAPSIGRAEFSVSAETRVWRDGKPIALADLKVGDELLLNQSAQTKSARGRCTDIWVGESSFRQASADQREKHKAFVKEHGMPAWVEKVDGQAVTVALFAGSRRELQDLRGDDPFGGVIYASRVDAQLKPLSPAPEPMGFKANLPETRTAGTYGSSGVTWVLEPRPGQEPLAPGQVLRLFKSDWPAAKPK